MKTYPNQVGFRYLRPGIWEHSGGTQNPNVGGAAAKAMRDKLKDTLKDNKELRDDQKHLDHKYTSLKSKFTRWIQLHSDNDISAQYNRAGGHKKISQDEG
jgi:hypothetical protein